MINIIESKGELNEIEKFKLHINEIDTITSVLLKLSTRLAKVENDLLMITDDNNQMKVQFSNGCSLENFTKIKVCNISYRRVRTIYYTESLLFTFVHR